MRWCLSNYKQQVKERDRVCQHCGTKGSRRNRLTVHHIVPKCHGGPNTTDNCILLCRKCHNEYHKRNGYPTPKKRRWSMHILLLFICGWFLISGLLAVAACMLSGRLSQQGHWNKNGEGSTLILSSPNLSWYNEFYGGWRYPHSLTANGRYWFISRFALLWSMTSNNDQLLQLNNLEHSCENQLLFDSSIKRLRPLFCSSFLVLFALSSIANGE